MAFVLFSGVTFANGYSQADRIADMQKMAQAMQDYTVRSFYNNADIVKAGVKELKETIVKIRPVDAEVNNKDIYEKWLNNNMKMTNKIQKKIRRKAEDIEAQAENVSAMLDSAQVVVEQASIKAKQMATIFNYLKMKVPSDKGDKNVFPGMYAKVIIPVDK